jgi:hypothetical protein
MPQDLHWLRHKRFHFDELRIYKGDHYLGCRKPDSSSGISAIKHPSCVPKTRAIRSVSLAGSENSFSN